jgi:hypothetical protein
MSGAEALVPLVASVSMFATIFGVVYIKSRENMALIERGINPKQNRSGPRPFVTLKYGLLLAGAGAGLLIAFLVDRFVDHKAFLPSGQTYYEDYPQIYFSLVALCGGLGLVLSYMIEKRQWLDKHVAEREERIGNP